MQVYTTSSGRGFCRVGVLSVGQCISPGGCAVQGGPGPGKVGCVGLVGEGLSTGTTFSLNFKDNSLQGTFPRILTFLIIHLQSVLSTF